MDESVFDRIIVNIIQMIAKIIFIINAMLPKAALPDAAFFFLEFGQRDRRFYTTVPRLSKKSQKHVSQVTPAEAGVYF